MVMKPATAYSVPRLLCWQHEHIHWPCVIVQSQASARLSGGGADQQRWAAINTKQAGQGRKRQDSQVMSNTQKTCVPVFHKTLQRVPAEIFKEEWVMNYSNQQNAGRWQSKWTWGVWWWWIRYQTKEQPWSVWSTNTHWFDPQTTPNTEMMSF